MLDSMDIKILRILSERGRISISDLAEEVGLSQTPTAKRVRRLEEDDLITGYQAKLNETRLGGSMTVFTWVSLVDQKRESLTAFEQSMAKSPEVMDCYLMTGDADYLLRIAVDGLDEFERFLTERVSKSDKVSSIRSSFALRPVALKHRPPLLSR
ncbi:MAG: Lrp/AsnC family transcriptional regulator [Henriciella sp.]